MRTPNKYRVSRDPSPIRKRFCFVIPLGFEPKTHSLEGCCSIQLSYGTVRPYRMRYVLRHKSNINTPTFQTHPAENRGGGVR